MIYIINNKCKGCHLCIKTCPKNCLILTDKLCKFGNQIVGLDESKKCIECGNCYLVCPDGAIKLKKE